jgi:hypothetical protein
MLNLQHQHNNHTTTPHMRVDSTHWGPLSCEGLLCDCCDGVVYESNPLSDVVIFILLSGQVMLKQHNLYNN